MKTRAIVLLPVLLPVLAATATGQSFESGRASIWGLAGGGQSTASGQSFGTFGGGASYAASPVVSTYVEAVVMPLTGTLAQEFGLKADEAPGFKALGTDFSGGVRFNLGRGSRFSLTLPVAPGC